MTVVVLLCTSALKKMGAMLQLKATGYMGSLLEMSVNPVHRPPVSASVSYLILSVSK